MRLHRLWILVAAVGLAAFAGFFALWLLFFRSDAPPPVNLSDAIATALVTTPTADTPATGTATSAATPTIDGGAPSDTPDSLAGTWTLAPEASFVGYRVNERLTFAGSATAVGRTSDVSGTLTFDGTEITAVEVQADLTTLRSDDSRRDGQLRRQALETSRFPTATFRLTSPIAVSAPSEGATVHALATGELTLHGVTRTVTIELDGQLSGGAVVVVGSLDVQFADYDISPPSAPVLLSVDDHGVMEFQLTFRRG